MPDNSDQIVDEAALLALYGAPGTPSLAKETDHLTPAYQALVEASTFLALATSGPGGLDVSPRGDAHGLVFVQDARTLLLPDRRGNNRLDSLRNILCDDRVALLMLVPGVGETLRVNGRARILVEPSLLARFAVDGKAPRTVLRISVERAYFQCSRAVLRGGLWDRARQRERDSLPSAGSMIAQASAAPFDARAYDAALPGRLADTLY